MHAVSNRAMIWRVSLARIEQVVSAHLGPGRLPGNAQGPCFSRQVSMYLQACGALEPFSDRKILQWPAPHDSSPCHKAKIETFRKTDEGVDALIEVLTNELAAGLPESLPRLLSSRARRFSKRLQR